MGNGGKLELRERFVGSWARGQGTPRSAAMRGTRDATRIAAELMIHIDDVSTCLGDTHHRARVSGWVQIDGVLTRVPCTGEARFYVTDADVGMKRCEYELKAGSADGTPVCLHATAFVRPGRATRAERETWYVRVFAGAEPATVIGAGIMRRRVLDRWRRPAARTPAYARWRQFVDRELAVPMSPVAT